MSQQLIVLIQEPLKFEEQIRFFYILSLLIKYNMGVAHIFD